MDLTDGMVLPTLGGGELTVDLSDGVVIDGVGSSAAVTIPDVAAGMSVVHVIDTVLLPIVVGGAAPAPEPEMEEASIADVASTVDDLSVLVDALVAADLVGALSDPASEFTVFAPTNDAFVALLGALGLESLEDVLLYHVVPAVAFSTDLSDGQVLPTLLEGAELTVDLTDGVGSDATVVASDVAACASVVHVIDTVLLPIVPGGDPPAGGECTARFGV